MLSSSQSRTRDHLDGDAVDALVAEHQAGLGDHGHAIWSLLTLEIFLRNNGW
jgi:hypothetical protein